MQRQTFKIRKDHLGLFLFNRSTGLNVIFDEVKFEQDQWAVAPRYVSIALTNACDLRCAYCYAPKTGARLHKDSVLSWSIELDQAGCLGLGFGGGEPTLFPSFSVLCQQIATQTQLAITMTTHGHTFTPTLSQQLMGFVHFIRLSMDGFGTTYEKMRERPFSDFVSKLRIVRDTAPFGVNFVVNEHTISDLERAADFIFNEGAVQLLLLPEINKSGNLNINQGIIDKLCEWTNDNFKHYRLACSAQDVERLEVPLLPVSQPANFAYEFLHIDAQGFLKLSAFDSRSIRLSDYSNLISAIRVLRNTNKNLIKRS